MIKFTIPLELRTKKNHSEIRYKNGHPYISPSQVYKECAEKCCWLIPAQYKIRIDYPVNVKCVYYMKTKRRVDKTNLESAIMDILVDAGVLKDDCAIPPIVVSTDGSRVLYDKQNPRVEVEIERVEYVD